MIKSIPTYIINLPERTDRLRHIKSQFRDKNEFDVRIVRACYDKIGAVGLWRSIVYIAETALGNNEEIIIMCEDDHEFSKEYSKESLFNVIESAKKFKANILLGGIIGGFNNFVPIDSNIAWVDAFWGTQFVIIFKPFLHSILNEEFTEEDVADGKFSTMTSNKFLINPMISFQKEFGYSDITQIVNDRPGHLNYLTNETKLRIKKLYRFFDFKKSLNIF